MRFQVGQNIINATPDNAQIVHYSLDIIDGIYIDLDDDYFFIPFIANQLYTKAYECALEDGIPEMDYTDVTDMSFEPHCFVVSATGRYVAQIAEEIANESEGV